MERTIRALEIVHSRLLAEATGPEDAQALMALAASVPQLAGIIEARVPSCATIMRPEAVRDLLVQLACDLLAAQSHAIRPRSARQLPY